MQDSNAQDNATRMVKYPEKANSAIHPLEQKYQNLLDEYKKTQVYLSYVEGEYQKIQAYARHVEGEYQKAITRSQELQKTLARPSAIALSLVAKLLEAASHQVQKRLEQNSPSETKEEPTTEQVLPRYGSNH